MAKILIVEDNKDYLELLYHFLHSAGYEVEAVRDGARAVEAVRQYAFDLVLLDLMLPKMDGYEACAKIREILDIPVIMLTALGSEEHQMRGYQMQIDEFVTKPVPMPVLLKKVEAVLRRTMQQEQKFCFEDLVMDVRMHQVTAAGEPVELTLREFEILKELMQHRGEVVTRKSLVAKLWGYDGCGETRVVDTHMKNLRKKLAGCDYIDTVRGVGYQLKKLKK